jgi:hypothetical protein
VEESEGRASERLQVIEEQQRRTDDDQLRMLGLGHQIIGGLTALGSCLFLMHVGMGILMLVNPTAMASKNEPAPPAFLGAMFIAMGSFAVIAGWTIGILSFLAGRNLKRRTGKKLIQVASGLMCLNMPLGTVLGVFTFLVLERESVRKLFEPR